MPRPDIAKAYPQYNNVATCGYECKININDLSNGTHSIGVGSIGNDGVELNYNRTVIVNKLVPRMNLESPAEGQTFTDDFTVRGWAITATGVDWVQISIDGQVITTKITEETRTDVKRVYPSYTNADKSGFSYNVGINDIKPGAHTVKADVWVDGKVVESQSNNFSISKLAARMNFESPNGTKELNDDFQVRGWALNPSGVREVNIIIDGNKIGTTTTGRPRGDVLNVFPAYNDSNSGFLYNVSIDGISDGQHTITVGVIGNDGTATSMSKTVTVKKPVTPQELLRRRLITIINNSKTIGTVSDSTTYDDVLYTFFRWHEDYDRGIFIEATYNAIPNGYKMDFLNHWADLLEEGTRIDASNVLSDDFISKIPNVPTIDNSFGNITCENKYDSLTALSYYYNYVLPKVLLLEPNYNIIKNDSNARENVIKNYFKSWAFVVYGPSKTEREAGETILRKVVSIAVDFSPLGNAKMIQEGITAYDIITGEKLSPGTRVVEVILGCLPVVGVGIKKGYTTLKGLKEAATYSKDAGLLKLAEDGDKIALQAIEATSKIKDLLATKPESIFEYVKETKDLGDSILCKTVDGLDVDIPKSELSIKQQRCLTGGCFTGDTLVMTKEGLKRIDSIQEGDFVLSKNTKTGQLDYKKVLYVYRKSTREFTNLIVAGRLIETTPTHLFMLEDGNWRSAENLKAGDRIVTANGKIETVDSVEEKHYNEARRIYNLNVDEFHTYFVGADELLVHNNCTEEMVKRVVEILSKIKVDIRKFSEYIFRPGGCDGKEVVYNKLGYFLEDSETLTQIYKEQAAIKYSKGEYTLGKLDKYGQRIDIEIELQGKGSATGNVSYLKSGWMINSDGTITLNTPFAGFTR